MIYSLKSSFFKSELLFDRAYMSYLEQFLLEGEEIIKSMSPYKSGEVVAWFTNKRIIFTSSPAEMSVPGNIWEIEFLPYKSIQRYSFLDGNTSDSFKIELFISDKLDISFFADNPDEAKGLVSFLGERCSLL